VTIRWALAFLLALTLDLSGCSDDDTCRGQVYEVELDQAGAETPIEALEAWLGGGHDGLAEPPDEDWIQTDSGDVQPDEVVLTNENGDGWWVSASRTSEDGWVVTHATDDASGCGDRLDG
jgi:hypothetical protein